MQLGLIVELDLRDGRPVITKAVLDPDKIDNEKVLFSHAINSLASISTTADARKAERPSKVIEEYCAEQVRANKWTLKTEHENRAIYTAFLGIVGDVPFTQLRYKELRDYKRILLQLPANLNKDPRYRGKSADEIIRLMKLLRCPVLGRWPSTLVTNI